MTRFVYYCIPDDNENESEMNIFIIYKNSNLWKYMILKTILICQVNTILDSNLNYKKSVLINFNDPVGALPKYDGKIIMKVSRVSFKNKEEIKLPVAESLFM